MNADERAQAVYRHMLPMVMSRGDFVAVIADAIREAEQAARSAALEEAAREVDILVDAWRQSGELTLKWAGTGIIIRELEHAASTIRRPALLASEPEPTEPDPAVQGYTP